MTTDPVIDDAHPDWCVPYHCTANRGWSGAHRSHPIIVNEEPLLITANLYADAVLPDKMLVEVRRNRIQVVLLPARAAHSLGLVMAHLGAAGEGIGEVLTGHNSTGVCER